MSRVRIITIDASRVPWMVDGFVPYDSKKRKWAHIPLPQWLCPPSHGKQCPSCLHYYPNDSFHKDSSSKDGRVRCCKQCVADRDKKRYHQDHAASRAKAVALYNANREYISARRKAKRDANIEEYRAQCKAYNKTHPEIVKAAHKRWRDNNREYNIERKRKWRRSNRLKVAIGIARYRARLRANQLHEIRHRDVLDRISVFGDVCAYCGGEWQELDHVIPIARGGKHCIANLRPSCRSCNRIKSDKPWKQWLRSVKESS